MDKHKDVKNSNNRYNKKEDKNKEDKNKKKNNNKERE
jgi:hypothetical protein